MGWGARAHLCRIPREVLNHGGLQLRQLRFRLLPWDAVMHQHLEQDERVGAVVVMRVFGDVRVVCVVVVVVEGRWVEEGGERMGVGGCGGRTSGALSALGSMQL